MKNSSKFKNDIIIGAILGDGSIRKDGLLYVCHGGKQKEYVKWKYNLFKEQFKLTYFERPTILNGKTFTSVGFYSSVTPYLKQMRKFIYKPNKQINRKQLNKLTTLGLAIWYMDDGSLSFCKRDGKIHGRQIWLSTHSFTYDEHLIIVDYLQEKWGIVAKIGKEKGKFRLWMNGQESIKFLNLIGDRIPESMLYKKCLRYGERKCHLNLCGKACSKSCPFNIL